MTHTVHGTLRKPAFVKQLQDSTMFAIELSELVKDYKTGEKTYSNYKAILFAKSQNAVDYYTKATAEGSFVVISSEKLKVEQREHNGKTYVSLLMDNARMEGAKFDEAPAQQFAQPVQNFAGQQAPQQFAQPAPVYPIPDDGIPF